MNRYIFADNSMKALDLSNPIRDSWDFIEAMKETGDKDLFASVSAVSRAVNLTADALSNMPFAVMKGEEDVDTSQNWQNVIGIMPRPRELLRLWRMSLFFTNTAYGRIAKTKPTRKELFYVEPSTIRYNVNKQTGELVGFERWLDGTKVASYPVDSKDFVWMWRLDHTTELLPSNNTEFKALAKAAGILAAADWWTENYFRRGAVKPTILAVKGMVVNDKKEELQKSWGSFIRNISRELTKFINAETMDVKQIGDGLGDIKDTPVYRQAIENVAMASGIPLSLLLSNSANMATANVEYAQWYRDSVTPWAKWMQDELNDSIFKPAGYFFEFRPEQSEPSQEEEVQRAGAFSTYVNAGMKPSLAAQIVGIDLPAGYEYEDLDETDEPAEDTPEDETEDVTEGEDTSEPTTDAEDTQTEDDMSMTVKAWEELETWKRKAIRCAKRGQPVTFDFVTEHLPAQVAETFRNRLATAQDVEEVKATFELGELHTVKAEGYKPPEAVQRAARRGLELRKKHGRGGLTNEEASSEGVGSGVQRATNLANGDSISLETVRRMAAFFARHEKNKEGGEDDAGYIAWQLWGGDAGRSWVNGILREVDGESKSLDEIKALADAINRLAETPEPVKAEPVKAEPMQVHVTMPSIVLNAQMPAQDAPEVKVEIPPMPAPVVTVNVPEQPAPVVNVSVPPAEVTVNAEVKMPEHKPITAELTTDPHTGKKILREK